MRGLIAGAVGATPPLTRRLVRDALTGGLRWFDDAWFDAGAHIDGFSVRDLHDHAATDALITRLFRDCLPRDRPLWRFQSLSDGERTLMAGQLHHVLADGVGAVELALSLIGGIISDQTVTSAKLPLPSVLEGVRDDLAGLTRGLGDFGVLRDLAASAKPIVERLLQHAGPDWQGEREIVRGRVELTPLLDGARASGGTLTAALVVATARALRSTGIIDADGSTAMVPLNARKLGESEAAATAANPISMIYASLPATGDPIAGLRRVTKELRSSRESAGALGDLSRRADDLPAAVRGTVTRAISGQFMAPVLVSSVPGPPAGIELFGRKITGMWGWAPSPAGQPVALSAVSYDDGLYLTLVGDVDGIVDGAATLRSIEHELELFSAAA